MWVWGWHLVHIKQLAALGGALFGGIRGTHAHQHATLCPCAARLQGHLSERDAALVMRQLLEFLAYAHDECNVVHRDIKPENLLLLDADAPQSIARAEAICAAGGNPEGMDLMCLKVCLRVGMGQGSNLFSCACDCRVGKPGRNRRSGSRSWVEGAAGLPSVQPRDVTRAPPLPQHSRVTAGD